MCAISTINIHIVGYGTSVPFTINVHIVGYTVSTLYSIDIYIVGFIIYVLFLHLHIMEPLE